MGRRWGGAEGVSREFAGAGGVVMAEGPGLGRRGCRARERTVINTNCLVTN